MENERFSIMLIMAYCMNTVASEISTVYLLTVHWYTVEKLKLALKTSQSCVLYENELFSTLITVGVL